MLMAADNIGGGSEMLLLVPAYAPLVGPVVVPIVGTIPDLCINFFATAKTGESIADNLDAGLGNIVGSNAMMSSLGYFMCIWFGRVNLIDIPISNGANTNETVKVADYDSKPKLSPQNSTALTKCGVSPKRDVSFSAFLALCTASLFWIVQLPPFIRRLEFTGVRDPIFPASFSPGNMNEVGQPQPFPISAEKDRPFISKELLEQIKNDRNGLGGGEDGIYKTIRRNYGLSVSESSDEKKGDGDGDGGSKDGDGSKGDGDGAKVADGDDSKDGDGSSTIMAMSNSNLESPGTKSVMEPGPPSEPDAPKITSSDGTAEGDGDGAKLDGGDGDSSKGDGKVPGGDDDGKGDGKGGDGDGKGDSKKGDGGGKGGDGDGANGGDGDGSKGDKTRKKSIKPKKISQGTQTSDAELDPDSPSYDDSSTKSFLNPDDEKTSKTTENKNYKTGVKFRKPKDQDEPKEMSESESFLEFHKSSISTTSESAESIDYTDKQQYFNKENSPESDSLAEAYHYDLSDTDIGSFIDFGQREKIDESHYDHKKYHLEIDHKVKHKHKINLIHKQNNKNAINQRHQNHMNQNHYSPNGPGLPYSRLSANIDDPVFQQGQHLQYLSRAIDNEFAMISAHVATFFCLVLFGIWVYMSLKGIGQDKDEVKPITSQPETLASNSGTSQNHCQIEDVNEDQVDPIPNQIRSSTGSKKSRSSSQKSRLSSGKSVQSGTSATSVKSASSGASIIRTATNVESGNPNDLQDSEDINGPGMDEGDKSQQLLTKYVPTTIIPGNSMGVTSVIYDKIQLARIKYIKNKSITLRGVMEGIFDERTIEDLLRQRDMSFEGIVNGQNAADNSNTVSSPYMSPSRQAKRAKEQKKLEEEKEFRLRISASKYSELKRVLMPFFNEYDVGRKGKMSREDFHLVMADLGESLDCVTGEQILFDAIDNTGSGYINFEEFSLLMLMYLMEELSERRNGSNSKRTSSSSSGSKTLNSEKYYLNGDSSPSNKSKKQRRSEQEQIYKYNKKQQQNRVTNSSSILASVLSLGGVSDSSEHKKRRSWWRENTIGKMLNINNANNDASASGSRGSGRFNSEKISLVLPQLQDNVSNYDNSVGKDLVMMSNIRQSLTGAEPLSGLRQAAPVFGKNSVGGGENQSESELDIDKDVAVQVNSSSGEENEDTNVSDKKIEADATAAAAAKIDNSTNNFPNNLVRLTQTGTARPSAAENTVLRNSNMSSNISDAQRDIHVYNEEQTPLVSAKNLTADLTTRPIESGPKSNESTNNKKLVPSGVIDIDLNSYQGNSNADAQPSPENQVQESEESEEEGEELEMPDDIAKAPADKQQGMIISRSIRTMATGVLIALIFADPTVVAMVELGERIGIGEFWVSFILAPLASNTCELINCYSFGSKKTRASITTPLLTLNACIILNNTALFAITLFAGALSGKSPWDYAGNCIATSITCLIVCLVGGKKTLTLLDGFMMLSLFPLNILAMRFLPLMGTPFSGQNGWHLASP